MSRSRRTDRRLVLGVLLLAALGAVLALGWRVAWDAGDARDRAAAGPVGREESPRAPVDADALVLARRAASAVDAFVANVDRCPASVAELGLDAGMRLALDVAEDTRGACLVVQPTAGGGVVSLRRESAGQWRCTRRDAGASVPTACAD